MASTTTSITRRIGAHVLLLDPHNRVLLIHARDPDQPDHHWWELPGGGLNSHGSPIDVARREGAEETGIHLDYLGPKLWIRESRFHYRRRDHHRIDHVYLGLATTASPRVALKPTDNESSASSNAAGAHSTTSSTATTSCSPHSFPNYCARSSVAACRPPHSS